MSTNKVALVTGSSRGIGAAVAEALSGAGYAVCINYIERKDKAEEDKSLIQKMFSYWYVPFLLIFALVLILLLRNAIYRHSRRKAVERRRRRAAMRASQAAEGQRTALRGTQSAMDQQTKYFAVPDREHRNRSDRGGKA